MIFIIHILKLARIYKFFSYLSVPYFKGSILPTKVFSTFNYEFSIKVAVCWYM